jgi:hypothetical protein
MNQLKGTLDLLHAEPTSRAHRAAMRWRCTSGWRIEDTHTGQPEFESRDSPADTVQP